MKKKKWKVIRSQIVYQTPYWKVRCDLCETLRGNTVEYYRIERAPAVCIIAFTKDRKIILQNQYRHPRQRWYIQVPAGIVEEGEDLKEAVARELREETGYCVKKIQKIAHLHFTPGILAQDLTVFLGFEAKRIAEPQLDIGEELETILIGFDEAIAGIVSGKIVDIDTVSELLIAKEYLEKNKLRGGNLKSFYV